MSFLEYFIYHGYQLLRVDFTSSPESQYSKLSSNFKSIIKKIQKKYGYDINFFCVKTKEGYGVLHTILAIKDSKAVWIDQEFLSKEWEKLNKAKIVSIKRMKVGDGDKKRVSKYFVSQYLSDQKGFDRYSYSWWKFMPIGKIWNDFKENTKKYNKYYQWVRGGGLIFFEFKEIINLWKKLICLGEVMIGEELFIIEGKKLVVI